MHVRQFVGCVVPGGGCMIAKDLPALLNVPCYYEACLLVHCELNQVLCVLSYRRRRKRKTA